MLAECMFRPKHANSLSVFIQFFSALVLLLWYRMAYDYIDTLPVEASERSRGEIGPDCTGNLSMIQVKVPGTMIAIGLV